MTGLEKILENIKEDAKMTANHLQKEAFAKKEEILLNAKKEGASRAAEIEQEAKEEEKKIIQRSDSFAELTEKRNVLLAKQEAIEHVLSLAAKKLFELDENEYFSVLLLMLKKYARSGNGEIVFNERDLKRLPDDFIRKLDDILAKKNGVSLSISSETGKFDGGFVLNYGDVMENCSFEALFLSEKDNLIDQVNSVLFQ